MKTVSLEEVCEITMGQAPKGETYNVTGDGLPLVAGAGDFGELHPAPKKFTSAEGVRSTQSGDIIVGIRASIGGRVLADDVYCLGRGVAGLRAGPSLDSRYLWNWVNHAAPTLAAKGRGATFLQVNKQDIAEMQISLPSLEEQRRIASILEAADELRTKCQQTINQLGTLVQAIFVDKFGDPVEATDSTCFLTDLADLKVGYPFKSATFTIDGSGIRICRNANVLPGEISWAATERVPESVANECLAFVLRTGDVLIGMDRPWISSGFKLAPVTEADAGSLLVQRVARLRPIESVPSTFVYELLRLPAFTRHCVPTETTIPHISPKDLQSFEIAIPSQENLVDFERAADKAIKTRAAASIRLRKIDGFVASLQQRAFRGDL